MIDPFRVWKGAGVLSRMPPAVHCRVYMHMYMHMHMHML